MPGAACREAAPWSAGLPAGWERMGRPSEPHAGAGAAPTSLLSLSLLPLQEGRKNEVLLSKVKAKAS